MCDEKRIALKNDLEIGDGKWEKIKYTADEMFGIWEKTKSPKDSKEIGHEIIDFINDKFLSKDRKAPSVKTVDIFYPILREVCGKNIPSDFNHAEIQVPSTEKRTPNDMISMIACIRGKKQIDNSDFNRLDIKLVFWLVYSSISSIISQDEMRKDIGLYAACMGMRAKEFSDVLNIIRYLLNDTLNTTGCKANRTKFLEELCSDIIESTADIEGAEEDPEDTFKRYFDARHTLIYVRTLEEKELMKHIVQAVNNHPEIAKNIYQWNAVDGLVNIQTGIHREDAEIWNIAQYSLEHTTKSISYNLDENPNLSGIYIFRTIELWMKDINTVSRIKILAEKIRDKRVFLIF